MSAESRETFFARLEPFYAPSVMLDIKLAYIMAKHGHRSQFRKEKDEEGERVRYFEHVRRVALILFDEGKCTRPEMIISALLHDGIEDTRDLSAEMIEHCFGAEVCSIVKILSKTPAEGYIDRFMICKDWRPYVIKACDRLDNLRSLGQCEPAFIKKQVKETREKYQPLFVQMMTLVPKKCYDNASSLYSKIWDQVALLESENTKCTTLL